MDENQLRYSKSSYIFPCIDVSNDTNSLKQLNILVEFSRKPNIYYKDALLLEINTAASLNDKINKGKNNKIENKRNLGYKVDWFGDCLYIYNIATNSYFFIGFINNYLVGYGNYQFSINKKGVRKKKIAPHIFENFRATNPIIDGGLNLKDIIDKQGKKSISGRENSDKNREVIHNNGSKDNKTNEYVEGFIFSIPYKKYKSKYNLVAWFSGFNKDDYAWDVIRDYFIDSFKWKLNAPKINESDLKEVWDDAWVLYRLNMYYPEGPFKYRWITPCRHTDYQYDKIAMWDTLHIIEDIKWYDPNLAVNLLEMQFELFRGTDGMLAQDMSCGDKFDGHKIQTKEGGRNFRVSQPPMWSYCFLELSKLLGHYNICGDAFSRMIKNIKWWEENRYFEEIGLFGYEMPAIDIAYESGLDNSPRFFNQYDGNKWKKIASNKVRRIITVDLNAQMADYYQNLGVIAMMREDERSNDYFHKAEQIIENIQHYLWDDDYTFFFDYDIETNTRQPIFSGATFWTLYGGCVLKGKLDKMIMHLTNPNKFWTDFPIPSIAIDSPFFEQDMWCGPTWLSQNYWYIIGLRRYNLEDLAAQLSRKCLNYLSNSYYSYKKFYEFYNPIGFDQKRLKRKGSFPGSPADYVGHFPIHSIYYYGLLGAEFLDECLNFIPKWKYIPSDLSLKLYYSNKQYTLSAEKYKTKYLEIARNSSS
ncbi:MAG: MGH1-like glycoside hydrolase domain-containing protein [Promethearchaeota archaeon]